MAVENPQWGYTRLRGAVSIRNQRLPPVPPRTRTGVGSWKEHVTKKLAVRRAGRCTKVLDPSGAMEIPAHT